MSTPDTTIRVYQGIPLDNTYRNVLHGNIADALPNAVGSWTNQTWCRINGKTNNKVRVRCDVGIYPDSYLNCNYISVQNRNNKTIYGFITDVLYINDNVVEFTFEIDCFHTYYNNYEFGYCLVERANILSGDNIGNYTLKEPVDLGYEYVNRNLGRADLSNTELCVIVAQRLEEQAILKQGGMYSLGVNFYHADRNSLQETDAITTEIKSRNKIASYYAPDKFLGDDVYSEIINVTVSDKLDGYKPDHNKLYTYPYNFIEVTNMQGQKQIYKYENFSGLNVSFCLLGVAFPAPFAYLYPLNYNGYEHAFDYGIAIQSFANNIMSSDTVDTYWATHKNQIISTPIIQTVTGASMGAFGGPLGALGGATLGLGSGIATQGAKMEDIKQHASDIIGIGGTDNINVVSGFCGFNINQKCVRNEVAKAIDGFFSKYGYQIDRYGTPPIDGNYSRKYIRTKGCNLINETMPTWAADTICKIHDNGVTYWRSLSAIGGV